MKTNAKSFANEIEQSINSSDYVADMLKYFQLGWDERGSSEKKSFINKLKAKVDMTLAYINDISNFLENEGIKLCSSHIKLKNPNSQSVLLVVSLEDYMSDKLLKIYPKTHNIEMSSRSDEYSVTFSFTYDEGNFDINAVNSHGFVTTHPLN